MIRFLLLFVPFLCASAYGAEPQTCPTDGDWLTGTNYLKALSLDLRGVVPTFEEYQEVASSGEVPEAWIDAWLSEEAFAERVVRVHRDLLWNNVSEVILDTAAHRMRSTGGIYWRTTPADDYRGETVYCGDFEASFDGDGVPIAYEREDGFQEGWVWVNPYWDPENPIRVCAFDAQENQYAANGIDCSTSGGRTNADCGCGPDLRWCTLYTQHKAVGSSFSKDVDLRVRENILSDAPYTDLFKSRFGYVNGPMADYFSHRTQLPGNIRFTELPIQPEALPDLDFVDVDQWERVDWGEQHAGILTSPAFLLRFQTNRSRADRFYNSFLCQPFQPPDTGLVGLEEVEATLDLTARAGCNGCHALLEPAAAYWGRWTEQGGGYLDKANFPSFSESCSHCAETGQPCDAECRYYLTDTLAQEQYPYVGWLNSYQFLDLRHEEHVNEGPALLVNRSLSDGRFSECTAKTTAKYLMRRELEPGEEEWLDELVFVLENSGFQYKELVRAIVTSDNYRRVR